MFVLISVYVWHFLKLVFLLWNDTKVNKKWRYEIIHVIVEPSFVKRIV